MEQPLSQTNTVILLNAAALHFGGGHTLALRFLELLPRVDPVTRYVALVCEGCGFEALKADNLSPILVPWRRFSRMRQFLFYNLTVPALARRLKASAVFSMGNFASFALPCPQAVIFHNPHFIYPETALSLLHSPPQRILYQWQRGLLRAGLRRSIVAAQTHSARRRLIDQFALEPRNVHVIPNALAHASQKMALDAHLLSRLAANPRPMKLLCLARYYPHKNLDLLLSVAHLLDRMAPGVFCILTTFSPADHPRAESLAEAIAACPGASSPPIVNLGPVPAAQTVALFRHCWACLFPTLLESFSGTYLEAMAAGRPILTSDRDFAREVCGEAALYFDPTNAQDVANAVLRLYRDPGLWDRLSTAALQRRRSYVRTWEDVTHDIVRLLHFVARTATTPTSQREQRLPTR